MGEFHDLMQSGFAEAVAMIGDTITVGGESASCVRTVFPQAIEFTLNGKLVTMESEVDILRTEAVRLNIEDRTECTIDGKAFRVVRIDDDDNDPCLKLLLAATR